MTANEELPPFVHQLSSLTDHTDDSHELPPDIQAEVDAQCEAFRVARAIAEVSSRGYIVF